MTDAAYTFKQTEIERKRSGRGAYAKKGGSRSKKCSLPSDKLTAKQRKELNGKMVTYNLTKPMNWIQFLQLSKDVRVTYIKKLIAEHDARACDMAKMFGITCGGFNNYLHREHKDIEFNWYPKKSTSEKWLDFVGSDESEDSEVSQPIPEENSQPAAPESVKHTTTTEVEADLNMVRLEIESGRLKFRGWPHAIFQKALLALDPSQTYKIEIYFEKEVV